MKVLVTGANGFLAGNIIRNLSIRGEEVYGMLRKNADLRNVKELTFNYVYGNLTNQEDLLRATKGMEVVIHAAAVTSPTARANLYHEVNVKASENLISAAIKNHCKRIIYISTSNTVGFGDIENPGTEELDISREYSYYGYATSKLAAEKIFKKTANSGLIEVIILNPVFMVGYNPVGNSTMKIFDLFLKSNPLIIPSGGKNFIYVDDAAKSVCNSIYKGRNGERYLLSNENLTYKEFYQKVESISKIRKRKIYIPDPILMIVGILSSLLNTFGLNLTLNKTNARILTIKSFYSSAKARTELDLPQTEIDVAINEALMSYSSLKPVRLK
ncbi:MAG: NAD-dependent epimerase/dehydratase family protein [Omnitrophica WOR_2 bacterium]